MLIDHKFVLFDLLAWLFLIICFFAYKKFYPKKKVSKLLLLIIISFLPLLSMLRAGSYESGDLSIHSSYAMIFFESLKEGNIFPIWDHYALNGYGYPFFLFIYILPYYFSTLFHFLGFSFISSMKLIAASSFIFSGIGMYLYVKEATKEDLAGFIAGIFYLFAPYHLIDLHFRFAIGEIMAFVFLPFSFYFMEKIKNAKSFRYVFLLSISLVFLILSHQAISLFGFIFLSLFSLLDYFQTRNSKVLVTRFSGLVIGILMAAFYWMPLFLSSRYTSYFGWNVYFYPLKDYIFSPNRLSFLYQGHFGELYFPIGYVQILLVFASIVILVFRKLRNKFFSKDLYFFSLVLILFISSFLIMQKFSKPLWEIVPFLKGFQFTYRFSVFISFFSSIIAGLLLIRIKQKKLIFLIVFTAISITILNWGNRKNMPEVSDNVLRQQLYQNIKVVGNGSTIWSNNDKLPLRRGDLFIESGSADFKEIFRNSTRHEYVINSASNQTIFVDNTLYFPGWSLYVNKKNIAINPNNLKNGLIRFELPKGLSLVEVVFKDTWISIFARLISLFTFTCVGLIFFLKNKK